jgi:hypothetical protein
MKIFLANAFFLILFLSECVCTTVEDHSHFSFVFGKTRNYRVFLPRGYKYSGKRYPVLYWFHGSGGSCTQVTYKSEFESYLDNHDLIIVNVDGTTESGTTWDYGLAFEFNTRTQEGKVAMTGMYFNKYIRELIGIIDSEYRTISDRDHRAVSGQSMGGLMAPWIASQNKDLFGSASMFSPSPDAAMFGPQGKEVCFVNRELYRSLKGIPVRLTAARGDRYRQYYREQKAVWELADLTHFEFHDADYPDHRAVDIPAQFNFHLAEFSKVHPFPENWHHTDPFPYFKVWDYEVNVKRDKPAFTILEKVTASGMLVRSATYLPEGPMAGDESINITTGTVYSPSDYYMLTDFNRSTGEVRRSGIHADSSGRLLITLDGGGHAIGISRESRGVKLFLIPEFNNEALYCEAGTVNTLNFKVINLGGSPSGPVCIRATTPKSYLTLKKDSLIIDDIKPGQQLMMTRHFPFVIANGNYGNPDNENFVTKISLEVSCKDSIQDISDIFIYPVAGTLELNEPSDLIILDGSSKIVRCYENRLHRDSLMMISGGSGNGNSLPEAGETIELWVRLPRGLGPADINTYHPAFLLNKQEVPWISVPQLKYNIKNSEYSGAANLQSRILIKPETPEGTELNLWLQCESYEFSDEGFSRPIQRHTFDYRRVVLHVGRSGQK